MKLPRRFIRRWQWWLALPVVLLATLLMLLFWLVWEAAEWCYHHVDALGETVADWGRGR